MTKLKKKLEQSGLVKNRDAYNVWQKDENFLWIKQPQDALSVAGSHGECARLWKR